MIERLQRMNEMPEREEIVKAMKEKKDSVPGEEGVRLGYKQNTCEEVRERVIEIVRMMFDKNEWDERAKSGIIVPLFKKGDRKRVNNYRGVCLLSMWSSTCESDCQEAGVDGWVCWMTTRPGSGLVGLQQT